MHFRVSVSREVTPKLLSGSQKGGGQREGTSAVLDGSSRRAAVRRSHETGSSDGRGTTQPPRKKQQQCRGPGEEGTGLGKKARRVSVAAAETVGVAEAGQ